MEKKRIMLVCSAAMSTSLLVTKMRQAAIKKNIDVEINAVSEADLRNHIDEIDIILLGPQVRFILNKVKEQVKSKSIPVDVINTMDYGMMNGEKVLEYALKILNEKK